MRRYAFNKRWRRDTTSDAFHAISSEHSHDASFIPHSVSVVSTGTGEWKARRGRQRATAVIRLLRDIILVPIFTFRRCI